MYEVAAAVNNLGGNYLLDRAIGEVEADAETGAGVRGQDQGDTPLVPQDEGRNPHQPIALGSEAL